MISQNILVFPWNAKYVFSLLVKSMLHNTAMTHHNRVESKSCSSDKQPLPCVQSLWLVGIGYPGVIGSHKGIRREKQGGDRFSLQAFFKTNNQARR